MADDYKSYEISCVSCDTKFLFSVGEQKFYAEKGLANRPKRCKSCRFARNRTKAKTPAVRPQPLVESPPRLSFPIPTVLGLVVEAARSGFSSAVGDGRLVRVRSSRPVEAGSYVSFTKSTIKGEYYLHEVLGPDHPLDAEKSMPEMKASVLDTKPDVITLRVHFNNAILSCPAPSVPLARGQRVLFTPSWAEGRLVATAITRPDASPTALAVSRGSAWGSPSMSSAAISQTKTEVIHPHVSSKLMAALGVTHDLACHPFLSSAAFASEDASSSNAVPRKGLLQLEELCVRGTWGVDDSKVSPSPNVADGPAPTTYLLLGSRSSGHLLTNYLRKSFEEIDVLGLERKLVVLYPIEEGINPGNFYGTTSSKLFQSRLLPILKVEILKEPIPLAQAYSRSATMTGKVTSQHMVAVHYGVTRDLSLDPHPPVTWLEIEDSPLDDPSEVTFDLHANPASSVRFSVPKNTLGLDAIREALPQGTLLHTVGHSMAASYTTYKAVFADADQAGRFVGIIGDSNRSHHTGPQWLAAPCSEFWGGANVFTIFTSKDFDKDCFYRLFQAKWAFAVNHTQVRFCTDLALSDICAIADRLNHTVGKRMTFYRIYGDGKGFILFGKRSKTNPFFPGEAATMSELKAHVVPPDGNLPIYLHNVPLSLTSMGIERLVHQIAPGAASLSISHASNSLSVQLAGVEAALRSSLLAQPCKRLGKNYLFLSVDGLDSNQATTSLLCSGEEDMPSFPQVLSLTKEPSAAAPTEAAELRRKGSAELPPGSAPESKSMSHPPQAQLQHFLRSEFDLELKRHLSSEATGRMDLVEMYLGDFTEDSLSDFLKDQDSLRGLARDIMGYVREELKNELESLDWEQDQRASTLPPGDTFVPDTQDEVKVHAQRDSTLPPGDTLVPDAQDEVGGYNFSSVTRGSDRASSPSSVRQSKRSKKQ